MNQPQEGPTRKSKLFGFIYFIILVAVSFFLSSMAMKQWDIYKLLDLKSMTLPLVNKSGDIFPEIAVQLALAAIIFFVLQFVTVFVISIFKKEEDEFERMYQEQRRR